MVVSNDKEIRRFVRSAQHRLKDAEYLLTGNRTTGAVYLAGYCVECFLKALVLAGTPVSKRAATYSLFKGSRAHSFIWLQREYAKCRGAPLPAEIQSALTFMTTWSVHLRYSPEVLKPAYAMEFLDRTRQFMSFASRSL